MNKHDRAVLEAYLSYPAWLKAAPGLNRNPISDVEIRALLAREENIPAPPREKAEK